MAEAARRRFVVRGAHEQTGAPVSLTVEASTAERADAGIRKSGILVSSVEPVEINHAQPHEGSDELQPTRLHDVDRWAAFKLRFYGAFGAAAAWIVVSLIVAAIASLFGQSLTIFFRK